MKNYHKSGALRHLSWLQKFGKKIIFWSYLQLDKMMNKIHLKRMNKHFGGDIKKPNMVGVKAKKMSKIVGRTQWLWHIICQDKILLCDVVVSGEITRNYDRTPVVILYMRTHG